MISSFTGCRKVNGDTSSANSSDTTSNQYGFVDVLNSEDSVNSEDILSDDASSTLSASDDEDQNNSDSSNTTDKNNTSSENIFTDNIVSIDDSSDTDGDGIEDNVTDKLPPTYVESTPQDSSNPSSYEKPTYVNSPSSKGRVKTVEIEAGRSVYYKISRVSNKVLTIENANAYVIYNGVTYSAKNGVVSFLVESDLLASDQILFEIGNSGSTNESFTILFTSPTGSKENPKVIESIGEKVTARIKKGNDQGYFYSYKATKDGKIRFYILSDAKKGMVSVDKLIDPKNFIIQQRNTTDTGEDYLKTDSVGTYVEFDVKTGDQFNIGVAANTTFDEAQITIEWKAVYA